MLIVIAKFLNGRNLTSDKIILQMVREDTIDFENGIPNKYNGKNPAFFPEEEVEIELSWKKCYVKEL